MRMRVIAILGSPSGATHLHVELASFFFFVERNKDQAVFLVAVALALFLWTGALVVISDFLALEDGGRAEF